MIYKVSLAIMVGLMLAPIQDVWSAQPIAAPSKDDIINALISKDSSTSRGFVQVPAGGTAAARPKTGATTASYTAPAPVRPAATSGHASIGVPILFDVNSANIKPESRATLANIASALQSATLKDSKILLEGHTDAAGTAEANMALSESRANAVKDFLVSEGGLSADRLSTIGKGLSEPVNPENPMAPENRRVVLVNLNN